MGELAVGLFRPVGAVATISVGGLIFETSRIQQMQYVTFISLGVRVAKYSQYKYISYQGCMTYHIISYFLHTTSSYAHELAAKFRLGHSRWRVRNSTADTRAPRWRVSP